MSLDDVKRLRTQFLDVIDGAIANIENGVEIGTSTKNSTDVKKRITKNKRTIYNEFNTLAMRWRIVIIRILGTPIFSIKW